MHLNVHYNNFCFDAETEAISIFNIRGMVNYDTFTLEILCDCGGYNNSEKAWASVTGSVVSSPGRFPCGSWAAYRVTQSLPLRASWPTAAGSNHMIPQSNAVSNLLAHPH